jgi:hypothetical protein
MTGGVTPKNIKFIEDPNSEFMESYLDGNPSLLDKVPLFAVMTEDLGVRGAHQMAVLVSEFHRALMRLRCQQKDAHTFAVYYNKGIRALSTIVGGRPYLLVGSVIVAMVAGILVGSRK